MLKFLIILILIIYVVVKLMQFLFRIFFLTAQSKFNQTINHQQKTTKRKAKGSNLNINYIPDNKNNTKFESKNKNDDYIDYEEIK